MIPSDNIHPTPDSSWGDRRIDLAHPYKTISSNHKTNAAEKLRLIAESKSRNIVNEAYDRIFPLAELAALEGKLFVTTTMNEEESEFIVQVAQRFRDNGFQFHSSEMGTSGRYAVRLEF